MKTFTGYEYLQIDVANNAPFGLDKTEFEPRIQWVETNMDQLESFAQETWKERPLYIKAVQALRNAQQGIPTGHLVGMDAICSGMQIMSVLTGCFDGAKATGLVDLNRRADAYTDCTKIMGQIQTYLGKSAAAREADRSDLKQAVMTALYGSKAVPIRIYGEGTEELAAFNKALYQLAPGACELLEDLRNSWKPGALEHSWTLPDGGHAVVKVMNLQTKRIEVNELNHATFTYEYYENEGSEEGLSNIANVVHSVDAYVLRSLIRRCNYDWNIVQMGMDEITFELMTRDLMTRDEGSTLSNNALSNKVAYYFEQYERSGMVDVVILPHLTTEDIQALSTAYLMKLNSILGTMREHKPFEVVTIHDDFKCHPNNMNHLRSHYRNILADIADSGLLDDLLSQLYGKPGKFSKKIPNLSQYIRQSNYGLS